MNFLCMHVIMSKQESYFLQVLRPTKKKLEASVSTLLIVLGKLENEIITDFAKIDIGETRDNDMRKAYKDFTKFCKTEVRGYEDMTSKLKNRIELNLLRSLEYNKEEDQVKDLIELLEYIQDKSEYLQSHVAFKFIELMKFGKQWTEDSMSRIELSLKGGVDAEDMESTAGLAKNKLTEVIQLLQKLKDCAVQHDTLDYLERAVLATELEKYEKIIQKERQFGILQDNPEWETFKVTMTEKLTLSEEQQQLFISLEQKLKLLVDFAVTTNELHTFIVNGQNIFIKMLTNLKRLFHNVILIDCTKIQKVHDLLASRNNELMCNYFREVEEDLITLGFVSQTSVEVDELKEMITILIKLSDAKEVKLVKGLKVLHKSVSDKASAPYALTQWLQRAIKEADKSHFELSDTLKDKAKLIYSHVDVIHLNQQDRRELHTFGYQLFDDEETLKPERCELIVDWIVKLIRPDIISNIIKIMDKRNMLTVERDSQYPAKLGTLYKKPLVPDTIGTTSIAAATSSTGSTVVCNFDTEEEAAKLLVAYGRFATLQSSTEGGYTVVIMPFTASEVNHQRDHVSPVSVSQELISEDVVKAISEHSDAELQRQRTMKMNNDELRKAVQLWFDDKYAAMRRYGHISTWNTSYVTDMSGLFRNRPSFNEDISGWNTSNVTTMRSVFSGAKSFNQNVNRWDVSHVTDMSFTFFGASAFNQPLNDWDVHNVTLMYSMFEGAKCFNQSLDRWDTSSVQIMTQMFSEATAFNGELSTWRVEKVTNMH